jgi:kumamolisin
MSKNLSFALGVTVLAPMALLCFGSHGIKQNGNLSRVPVSTSEFYVPETSIPRLEDVGLRFHTNHIVYIGRDWQGYDNSFEPLSPSFGPSVRSSFQGFKPSDIRTAYGLPSTGGSGAIAIVDAYDFPTALNCFNTFATKFALAKETSTSLTASTNKVFQVVYQGTTAPKADVGWNQEASLDIEWAHALAPNAKIYLVEANSSSITDLMAAVKKASTLPGVKEVSMSFGGSEFSGETTFDSYFTTPGVVYFASAGDTGGVAEYPSESPNVVAVGGTSLTLSGNVVSSETAWGGSGGGISFYEPIPAYQSKISTIVGKKRGAPDISLVADPKTGVQVYLPYYDANNVLKFAWYPLGGTSVSAPCCAAIANLSGHFLASSTKELTQVYGYLGTANFRDVIKGTAGGYAAAKGWDKITGVGSPIGIKAL